MKYVQRSVKICTNYSIMRRTDDSDAASIELHYWVTTCSVLPTFHQYFMENGYETFAFIPFSSELAWIHLNPICAIKKIISPRDPKMAPHNITSYSLMSTSLSLPDPPTPPSTAPFDQTMALIN